MAAVPRQLQFLSASASTEAGAVRLSTLAPGQTATLHGADLAAHDCALLNALGLTDRCVLRICKIGEPCIVQVHATRIGLARSVADSILVVPQGAV
jgi:Fe2+ transport system protein FeoA